RLDLNLLVVLNALLRERSVTRAAETLNLSQPAMSAALTRLRTFFNDPLLVPHGKRMLPTSLAQELAPLVEKSLTDIDALITSSTVFDPATSRRTFRICTSDYVTVVLLQPLLVALQQEAPGLRFEITPVSPDIWPQFEQGKIDCLLTPEQYTSNEHPRQLLFDERHVVVGWKRNPLFKTKLTEEAFFAHGQAIFMLNDAQSFAEQELAKLNRERHIEIKCGSFLTVPWLLPETKRLALMHERLALLMLDKLPLTMAPLPFRFPIMREMVQYHAARANDSGLQWLLKRIHAQAAKLRRRKG
ncbi:MAG TPA: LysR family transcriptional regulator, partial [Candidatus Acidoferrum sp.]|nr:LysR family transcriptional regulator [Candidatus Acidoferrum sp.]